MTLEESEEETSAQMNPENSTIEERKEVPVIQILPVTAVTVPVPGQPRRRVGRTPFQDYVGRCRKKIAELEEKITLTRDPAELRRLRSQLQAAKQRMNKSILEGKEQEHLEVILSFLSYDKRSAIRTCFFDFNVSDDLFKDIV